MHLFWQKNVHDWWRIITQHGDIFGEPIFKDDAADFEATGCRLHSTVQADKSGVKTRVDTIFNTGDKPLNLNCMNMRFVLDGGEYEVYTQYNAWQNESLGTWHPLVTEITASSESFRTCYGAAPMLALWNKQTNRGIVFHYLPDCAWCMSARRSTIDGEGENSQIVVEIGPEYRGLNKTLAPGESITLPSVLYYETTDRVGMDAWRLHRYCHTHWPRKTLPVIYNTWMCHFDNVNYDVVAKQIPLAADLGAEYFVLDAGWFGNGAGWSQAVGDWTENMQTRYAGRVIDIANLVRSHGMKFGLWFEPERAAADSTAMQTHPDYFIQGNVGFNFTDFSNPDACNFVLENISATIEKYGVEFVKFDFNADLLFDNYRTAFLDHFKGYHVFLNRLKQRFPSLYIENCASGGERLNLANIQEFESFWYSDCQSPYYGMRMIKDGMRRMPPQIFERWFVAQSAQIAGAGKVQDKLLVCEDSTWDHVAAAQPSFMEAFMSGGPIGLSCDLSGLSEETYTWLKAYIAKFKQERDFWRTAECRILTDTGSMLVLQYNDPSFKTVRLQAIASKVAQTRLRMYPQVPVEFTYRTSDGATISGAQLATEGVTVMQSLGYRQDNRRMQEIVLEKIN